MDFRLLGPIEVLANGRPVELGPYKQRALLALLAINANRLVSTDRIIEALWGESATDKERALWVYVSRLRSALEPDREGRGQSSLLIRRDPGYELRIPEESVDSARFERLVETAESLKTTDPERAMEALEEGLELWRGEPLDEFLYESFAAEEISRLNELRMRAREARIDLALALGQSSELVGELVQLSGDNPYRERPVSQLMLALYRSGRQAEALRVFDRHRRIVGQELGLEPSVELTRLQEQILLHDEAIAGPRTGGGTLVSERNPFKGLLPFEEDDAGDFYGRDQLVAEILRRIESGEGLITLVGPSGSGKSSVVRAGVVPKLRKGVIAGSDLWQFATMVPAQFPFTELEIALLRSSIDPPDGLSEQLGRRSPDSLLAAALRVMSSEGSHLVLVVDQFEELFTTVEDVEARGQFLEALLTASSDSQRRVTILLALRADMYDHPLRHPAFGARMGSTVVNVTPMSVEELEEAAVQPAAAAGLRLEQSLLVQLVSDIAAQPGGLPMFQYTLTELVERRSGAVLTAEAYSSMGGVAGAISMRAEDVFGSLEPEEKEAARQLFLRLVAVTPENALGRRRVMASHITSLDVDVVSLQTVIARFAEARLLSLDHDTRTRAPTVEVAHEALLSEWDRLGQWIEGARRDLALHASLTVAVSEWEASQRHEDYLVRGTRLAEFQRLREDGALDLNSRELDYLDTALQHSQDLEAAEAARKTNEASVTARARRRLWTAIGAVAGAIAALGVWLFGFVLVPTVAIVGTPQPDLPQPGGYTALMQSGFDQAEAIHRFQPIEIAMSVTDLAEAVANVAPSADLVVSSEFLGGPTAELIRDNPDTVFAILSRYPRARTGLENEVGVTWSNEEGAFLAGAAAALVSRTRKVGFFGAVQAADAIDPARAGFEAGARFIDSDIDVVVTHRTDAFEEMDDDYGLVRQATEDMYRSGVDVILEWTAAQDLGIRDAALAMTQETGVKRWMIGGGDGSDKVKFVPPEHQAHVLWSVVRKVDSAVFTVIDAFMRGEAGEGQFRGTLASGGLKMGTMAPELAPHVDRLEEIEAQIIDGSLDPPAVPSVVPLPHLGFDPTEHVATVVVHEDYTCSLDYQGPDPSPPMMLTYHVENRSDRPFYFGERFVPDFFVAKGVSVLPRASTILYYDVFVPESESDFFPDIPMEVQMECAPYDVASYELGQPLQTVSFAP